jgi:hypothetical protein
MVLAVLLFLAARFAARAGLSGPIPGRPGAISTIVQIDTSIQNNDFTNISFKPTMPTY